MYCSTLEVRWYQGTDSTYVQMLLRLKIQYVYTVQDYGCVLFGARNAHEHRPCLTFARPQRWMILRALGTLNGIIYLIGLEYPVERERKRKREEGRKWVRKRERERVRVCWEILSSLSHEYIFLLASLEYCNWWKFWRFCACYTDGALCRILNKV